MTEIAPIFFNCESGSQSRSAFDRAVARIASGLQTLGLVEGDTVALLMRNDAPMAQAMAAADLAGIYAVPLNWHGKSEEIGYVLQDCGARVLIAHDDLLALVDADLLDKLQVIAVPTPKEIAVRHGVEPAAADALAAGHIGWQSWLDAQQDAARPTTKPRGVIMYTSGTTGKPKGVQREPYADLAAFRQNLGTLHHAFGTQPGMHAAILGPLYHGGPTAYWRACYAATAKEGMVVVRSKFDPIELLQLIQDYHISHLFMVPTMFIRLLKLPPEVRARYDVSSVRHIIHTAAPCPVAVKAAMCEWMGDVIYEFYGASETGPVTVATPQDARERPGTVGHPQSTVRMQILDADGLVLPAGEIGEICCRNDTYPDFTYRNRHADRAALDRQGLVATGDMGYLDEGGYLFVCDRVKDMVISGGVNIYPAEIEAALIDIAGIQDCAVFGIPHEEYGEALAAHVQLAPGAALTAEEISTTLLARLTKFKVPSVIRFETQMPRQDNGKIYKRRLSEPYWAGHGRRI